MSNLLRRAAEATACQMLEDIGQAGTRLSMWTAWTGKPALVPLGVGALSYMANNLLCDPTDGPPSQPDSRLDGCIKGSNPDGYSVQYKDVVGDTWGVSATGFVEIVEVQYVYKFNGTWGHRLVCRDGEGNTIGVHGGRYQSEEEAIQYGKYRLDVPSGECQESNDPTDPGNPRPPNGPYNYTDPETNCNYTLNLEGFVQQYEGGPAQPVWRIESSGTRADGGRIGGCNLSPTIYIGGNGDNGGGGSDNPGGGPPQVPVPSPQPPDGPDGEPWWLKPLVGGAIGALLNQILDLLTKQQPPNYNNGSFVLTAPCDKDEQGNALRRTWDFPQQNFYQRVVDHQVATLEVLQQHLNWKTPICREQRPQPEGTWISTRWISDGISPGGERPLRKLFRYRSKSTLTDEQLRDWWADFSWQAGPVCVIHKGAWWGTPQVWASTEEEGKRVLRRAGSEAGLDPDQTGEWLVSSSDSSRYGMSGTMRLEAPNGIRWVTRRDGPSSVPS